MSKRLEAYFAEYASYHQARGNQLSHFIGIPLIVATLLGLLSRIAIFPADIPAGEVVRLDGGTALLALATLWYLMLDWRLAVPFALFGAGMYFLGRALPPGWLWALFIAGWVLQGIGHAVYEKKSPAFLKNFEHLLIGPLWIFAKSVGYRADPSNESQPTN